MRKAKKPKKPAPLDRASYALREIATRNGVSLSKVYADAAAGLLETEDGLGVKRATPEAEIRWRQGKTAAAKKAKTRAAAKAESAARVQARAPPNPSERSSSS